MSRRKKSRLDKITRIPEEIPLIEDPRASRRRLRLESVIFRALSSIVLEFVNNPVLSSVSLTKVVLSPDLRHAKIFFASSDPNFNIDAAIEEFQKSKGYIRSRLGEEIRVKYIPKLHFYPDKGLYNAWNVDEVLKKIHDYNELSDESASSDNDGGKS